TALAKLYDFQQAGGQVKLHVGVTDDELVFQNLRIEKKGNSYLLKTTDGLFVYGRADYRREIHVQATPTAYSVSLLAEAYDQLASDGGTIVLENTQNLTASFNEPAHTGKITVRGASDANGNVVGTINVSGASRQYYLGGPTTFENVNFTSSNNYGLILVANYHPIVIGENVTCSGFTTTETATVNNFTVVGGFYKAAGQNSDVTTSDITVKSGQRVIIIGQDLAYDSTHSYDSKITVEGGDIFRFFLLGDKGTHSGNITVNIKGGTFAKTIVKNTWSPADGKTLKVTVTGGSFAEGVMIEGIAGKSTLYVTESMKDTVLSHINSSLFTVETITE
ncbi:MAG: hypothetical protein IJE84_06240, partial [Clostridia bacterium]|nr:hypothetical protein [Clostridia bacterium]